MSKEKEGGQENDNENQADQKNSQTWNLVREKLSEYISGDAFSRWFKNAELVDPGQKDGLVAVQSDMHQIWIETNYMDELRAAFAEGAGIHCSPQIVVKGDVEADLFPETVVGKIPVQQENQKIAVRGARTNSSVKVVTPNLEEKTQAFQRKLKRLGINPEFDFESFVVGDKSQFAHAACSAVAHQEGRSFNPLFIHGRAGLGKTHLMSAVAQQLLANDPKAKVVFLTAEHFANEFIEAVRKGNLEAFRKAYRHVDAMLIDDIQFIAGKERTQDEFFHTFNALLNSQTQVILTCDCPALEIQTLDSRLISRF